VTTILAPLWETSDYRTEMQFSAVPQALVLMAHVPDTPWGRYGPSRSVTPAPRLTIVPTVSLAKVRHRRTATGTFRAEALIGRPQRRGIEVYQGAERAVPVVGRPLADGRRRRALLPSGVIASSAQPSLTGRAPTIRSPSPQTHHVPACRRFKVRKRGPRMRNDSNTCELWATSGTKRMNATSPAGSSTA